ncbi:hypothetical protein [Pedobacter foliorum]|uniref:hypothetical protein n=1 Tax=Pedobacter foliorum TaxID=2739058 RepID=UPI001566E30A|nr:hypothetical protein [Pedobacter foliorum]NRF40196.1 hypothetical protein [Pedobacter foliorum]
MKTFFPIIGMLGSLLFFSCNSSENQVKNSDTLVTVHQPKELRKDSVGNQKEMVSEHTLNLIKLGLGKMFKDDLSKNLIDEQSRKFKVFEYNINEEPKKEIFVGLTGPYFCGSGGCTVLLLNPEGELVTKFTVTESPLLIADTFTMGWRDLILHSQGKDHLMKFNGKTYPSNPSVQPDYAPTSSQNLIKGLGTTDQSYSW